MIRWRCAPTLFWRLHNIRDYITLAIAPLTGASRASNIGRSPRQPDRCHLWYNKNNFTSIVSQAMGSLTHARTRSLTLAGNVHSEALPRVLTGGRASWKRC
ncbi:MAG: hypothetical protein EBE86_002810 [Hormoscilla sp. GUM202]|nr:hypothetical protein [Hormoscilla sp. GUM202]